MTDFSITSIPINRYKYYNKIKHLKKDCTLKTNMAQITTIKMIKNQLKLTNTIEQYSFT